MTLYALPLPPEASDEVTAEDVACARYTLDRVTNRVPSNVEPDTWSNRSANIRQLEQWIERAERLI